MSRIPVIGFAAYSGTGKTTLIEKLVRIYKEQGLRVAVIKHDAHDFLIDREGKDSWRFTQAGADMTLLSSAKKAAVIESRPLSFEDLVRMVHDVDLILTEGYKSENIPRIGLYRKASGSPLPVIDGSFAAVVTDTPLPEFAGSQFSFEQTEELAAWILDLIS